MVSSLGQNSRVLLVDDNEAETAALVSHLEQHGYLVSRETNGATALLRIRDERPDIVLLELDLPGENGLTVCKLCRQHYAGPVVFLTHKADELDQVLGLDMGADDYICKSSGPRLIQARMAALLRRTARLNRRQAESDKLRLTFDDLVIDYGMREVWLGGENIDMTSAEFDLLWLLASNAGTILTREEIFHKLRGIDYDGQDRSVDVRVSRIRPKVGDDPIHPRRIKTVRSRGYLFCADINQGV